MGLSAANVFLLEANRAAVTTDYFRWRTIGTALGYSEAESEGAMKALAQRKLAILLADGDARMLASGRQAAMNLERRRGTR